VTIAFFSSPKQPGDRAAHPLEHLGRLRRLSLLATALIYAQVVFGAILRHTGARLDAHLVVAGLVSVVVLMLGMHIRRHHVADDAVVRPLWLLCALLIAQLSLGLGAYLVTHTAMAAMAAPFVRVSLTTVHLAVGSLMLVTCLLLTLRTYRLEIIATPISADRLLAQQVSL
jgi:cytochrome c oxidase assembly protein subunit 15